MHLVGMSLKFSGMCDSVLSNSSGGEIGSFCLGRISHVPDLASGILITVLMCPVVVLLRAFDQTNGCVSWQCYYIGDACTSFFITSADTIYGYLFFCGVKFH